MLLLRDIPDKSCLDSLSQRYPEMNGRCLATVMTFLRTATDLIAEFEKFLAAHGLSQGRFAVLAFLNREPDRSVNQTHLAEAYGVTKATITGLIDGLERDGLVERLADPADRRASLVRLTAKGRKFLDAFMPHHLKRTAAVFSEFRVADHEALLALMCKLRGGMEHVGALERKGTLSCNPVAAVRTTSASVAAASAARH